MAALLLGRTDGESYPLDVSKTGADIFCADGTTASQFVASIAGSVDADKAMLVMAHEPPELPGRETLVIEKGLVPGLDVDPDWTSFRLFDAMAVSGFHINHVGYGILKAAAALAPSRRISLAEAVSGMASFFDQVDETNLRLLNSQIGRKTASEENSADEAHLTAMVDMLGKLPDYVPAVGRNQRKETKAAYDAAYVEIERFMARFGDGTVGSMDLKHDWQGCDRPSARDVIVRGGAVVVVDRSDPTALVESILQSCSRVRSSIVVVRHVRRTNEGFPYGYPKVAPSYGSCDARTTTVFHMENPSVLTDILRFSEARIALVCDDAVLPYESMQTIDPDAFAHFNVRRSESTYRPNVVVNAYDEASMHMAKISFLEKIQETLRTRTSMAEPLRYVEGEIALTQEGLGRIAGYIADRQSSPLHPDMALVVDKSTNERTKLRHGLYPWHGLAP